MFIKTEDLCIHFTSQFPHSPLWSLQALSFFWFLYNRTRTTVVMHQALSLYIPALSTFQEHVIPSPQIWGWLSTIIWHLAKLQFVIVNFASCFQTQIIPAFKVVKGKCVSPPDGAALLSRGLFFFSLNKYFSIPTSILACFTFCTNNSSSCLSALTGRWGKMWCWGKTTTECSKRQPWKTAC